MKDPKADADPSDHPLRAAAWAEKKYTAEYGYFGWWGLIRLLFFGR